MDRVGGGRSPRIYFRRFISAISRRRCGAGCRGGGFGNGLKGLRAGAHSGGKAPRPKRGLTSAKYWIHAKRKVNRREEEGTNLDAMVVEFEVEV